jgi:hypothetical protein
VTQVGNLDEWERWLVVTPDSARYPSGSRVLVNAPVLLKSFHGTYLNASGSGDIRLWSDANTSHVRINGPLVARW